MKYVRSEKFEGDYGDVYNNKAVIICQSEFIND